MKNLLLTVFLIISAMLTQSVHAYIPISDEQLFEFTPLMAAIEKKDITEIKSLIKASQDVDEYSKSGGTALMLAARVADFDTVTLLLQAGAKPDNCGEYGYCPLWYAVDGNNFEIVKLIVTTGADPKWNPRQNGTEYPPLHNAVSKNNLNITQYLIELGADIEFKDYFSNIAPATPLAVAVANGNFQITKYLISRGAKLHEATEIPFAMSLSALEHARAKDHMEVVDYIEVALERGELQVDFRVDDFMLKLFTDSKYDIIRDSNLAKEFLSRISMQNMRLIRNAIFARKNYIFRDNELTVFYKNKFGTYKPESQNVVVSEIDKKNIKFLMALEKIAYRMSVAS